MKKLLAILLLTAMMTACSSCALNPWHTNRMSVEDISHSVYRVSVDVTMVPVADEDGVEPDDDKPVHQRWTGTAWVADRSASHSTLVTAGHVCESRDFATVQASFFGIPVGPAIRYRVGEVKYSFLDRDGVTVEGATVLVDDDDVDICVLAVTHDMGEPLGLADSDPKYGQAGWYIGAPRGIWGGGTAPILATTYSGRGTPFNGKCAKDVNAACTRDELLFSVDASGGASGGPVIVDGRVVAELNVGGAGMFIGVPWDDIRRALRKARHEIQ